MHIYVIGSLFSIRSIDSPPNSLLSGTVTYLADSSHKKKTETNYPGLCLFT